MTYIELLKRQAESQWQYDLFSKRVFSRLGMGNKPIARQPPPERTEGEIKCRTRLGGLLKHYYRAAA